MLNYAAAGLVLRLLDKNDGLLRARIICTLSDTLKYTGTSKAAFYDSMRAPVFGVRVFRCRPLVQGHTPAGRARAMVSARKPIF